MLVVILVSVGVTAACISLFIDDYYFYCYAAVIYIDIELPVKFLCSPLSLICPFVVTFSFPPLGINKVSFMKL